VSAGLRKAWEARSPRERIVLAALAAVLAAAGYGLLLQSAERGRKQLGASVTALRTQAALLDQHAAEHQLLRAAPAAPVSPTELRALVQARADAARLSGALTRIEALDADHVQAVFGAVSFADWLAWIAALQAQNVSLDAARIEALSAPGMVSVTATLGRARAQ
jgi:general secretion pathway protein M